MRRRDKCGKLTPRPNTVLLVDNKALHKTGHLAGLFVFYKVICFGKIVRAAPPVTVDPLICLVDTIAAFSPFYVRAGLQSRQRNARFKYIQP